MAQTVKDLLDKWFATNQSHWRAAVRRPASATKATTANFTHLVKSLNFAIFEKIQGLQK